MRVSNGSMGLWRWGNWNKVGIVRKCHQTIKALIIVMIVGMLIAPWTFSLRTSISSQFFPFSFWISSPKFFTLTWFVSFASIFGLILPYAAGRPWFLGGTIKVVALPGELEQVILDQSCLYAGIVLISGGMSLDRISAFFIQTGLSFAAATAETCCTYMRSWCYTTAPVFNTFYCAWLFGLQILCFYIQ